MAMTAILPVWAVRHTVPRKSVVSTPGKSSSRNMAVLAMASRSWMPAATTLPPSSFSSRITRTFSVVALSTAIPVFTVPSRRAGVMSFVPGALGLTPAMPMPERAKRMTPERSWSLETQTEPETMLPVPLVANVPEPSGGIWKLASPVSRISAGSRRLPSASLKRIEPSRVLVSWGL